MKEVAALVDTSDRGSLAARIMKGAGIVRHSGSRFSEEDALPFEHTRSFLRVQDGCDGECSYCIVPSVRGKPTSRSFDETIRHARKLIDAGIPEIVLTGITIGKYSDSGQTLAGLAERILSLEGDFRLRITSIEPTHLTGELVALFNHEKLCPHIHLPLQSGSDPVLKRMSRPYTADFFRKAVDRLRLTIPDVAIGTDVIVGFPGETEDQFLDTIRLCKEIGFAFVHQFSWSPRKGTLISGEKRIPGDIVAERSKILRALTLELSHSYASRFVGCTVDSIIDRNGDALTPHYLKVAIRDSFPENFVRKILPVYIESLDVDGLHGIVGNQGVK
jgi:threonylcarbamoyladenosine tRNA methylthiotransferase MtaB